MMAAYDRIGHYIARTFGRSEIGEPKQITMIRDKAQVTLVTRIKIYGAPAVIETLVYTITKRSELTLHRQLSQDLEALVKDERFNFF